MYSKLCNVRIFHRHLHHFWAQLYDLEIMFFCVGEYSILRAVCSLYECMVLYSVEVQQLLTLVLSFSCAWQYVGIDWHWYGVYDHISIHDNHVFSFLSLHLVSDLK